MKFPPQRLGYSQEGPLQHKTQNRQKYSNITRSLTIGNSTRLTLICPSSEADTKYKKNQKYSNITRSLTIGNSTRLTLMSPSSEADTKYSSFGSMTMLFTAAS